MRLSPELLSLGMTSPRSQHSAQGRRQDDRTALPCEGSKYCLRVAQTANFDTYNGALNTAHQLHTHMALQKNVLLHKGHLNISEHCMDCKLDFDAKGLIFFRENLFSTKSVKDCNYC